MHLKWYNEQIVADGKQTGTSGRGERCCVLPDMGIYRCSAISIKGAVDEEFAHLMEMSQNKFKFEQVAFEMNTVI